MKNKIISLLCVLVFLLQMLCPAVLAEDTIPFEGAWTSQALLPEKNGIIYEITKEYAAVRDSPYESGKVIHHFHKGEYIKGEIIRNLKFNKWLTFKDSDGKICYLYSGNIKEHTSHCWSDVIEAPTGRLAVCDCGYTSLSFDRNSQANITVDGLEYIKQIILGNYSDTHSFTAAFATMLLGLTPVGTICDIRDLSADVYFCAKGDCDFLSLSLDFLAFVPLLDALVCSNSRRAVKIINVDDLDVSVLMKYTDDIDALKTLSESDCLTIGTYSGLRSIYAGKSRALEIEDHHLVEKRFAQLFNVNTDEFLSTPLWTATHDDITARWRKAIPYSGGDYSHVTYQDMVDAVNYVYSDNTLLRKHTLEWVSQHWAA